VEEHADNLSTLARDHAEFKSFMTKELLEDVMVTTLSTLFFLEQYHNFVSTCMTTNGVEVLFGQLKLACRGNITVLRIASALETEIKK